MTTTLDFDLFYRANYGRLIGTLRLVTGDIGTSEEIAQEAFMKAFSRWSRVQEHESPEGWLFTTALNLSRRRWRRLSRASSYQPGSTTSDDHDSVLDRSALVAALGRLPLKQRSVVVVRHVLGYSTEEAAEILSMTPANLRTTLHRAISTLRLDPSFLAAEGRTR